jgi:hypothetical protein
MPVGYLAVKLLTSKIALYAALALVVAFTLGLVEAADFLGALPDVSLDPMDYIDFSGVIPW